MLSTETTCTFCRNLFRSYIRIYNLDKYYCQTLIYGELSSSQATFLFEIWHSHQSRKQQQRAKEISLNDTSFFIQFNTKELNSANQPQRQLDTEIKKSRKTNSPGSIIAGINADRDDHEIKSIRIVLTLSTNCFSEYRNYIGDVGLSTFSQNNIK